MLSNLLNFLTTDINRFQFNALNQIRLFCDIQSSIFILGHQFTTIYIDFLQLDLSSSRYNLCDIGCIQLIKCFWHRHSLTLIIISDI